MDGRIPSPAGIAGDCCFKGFGHDQTQWVFSDAGQLTAIKDRYGNASALTYVNPPNNNQPGCSPR